MRFLVDAQLPPALGIDEDVAVERDPSHAGSLPYLSSSVMGPTR